LVPIEFNLAQHLGVARPEKVRILSVPRTPLPLHLRVQQLGKEVGLLDADTGGLTAVYGVIVRRDRANNLRAAGTRIRSRSPVRATGQRRISFKNTFNKSAGTDTRMPFRIGGEAKATKACRDAGVLPF
jgi:hypothetical protein